MKQQGRADQDFLVKPDYNIPCENEFVTGEHKSTVWHEW